MADLTRDTMVKAIEGSGDHGLDTHLMAATNKEIAKAFLRSGRCP